MTIPMLQLRRTTHRSTRHVKAPFWVLLPPEAVRGISDFFWERLTQHFLETVIYRWYQMWESFKPDVKGYKDILTCGSCRSSGRPQLPKLAPRHLIKSYERGCHWRQTRVLLPLFWMRKKRVQVHRNAGNNPCKWRAEEESEQSLEKLREGREKAEIKKCAWAAKYLTMALQAQTRYLHVFLHLNFRYSWLLFPGTMLL